uniref:Uncharacterized protein n=1 Tax=Rhizophora mucronata TaxID=61149 RepID=A0A2P2QBK1_RHIMU
MGRYASQNEKICTHPKIKRHHRWKARYAISN